jgi:hypothetical protein
MHVEVAANVDFADQRRQALSKIRPRVRARACSCAV